MADMAVPSENRNKPGIKAAVWVLFVLALIVFLSSLYAREITLDDAYFAEQSYWYDVGGYVRTDLFRGILDWEERSFAYHKLHVWQGALLIKLAGWNAYFFKSLPVLYLVFFVLIARFYLSNFVTRDHTVFVFFLFLLFIHTFIAQYGFEFRPEIMIMTVGFASFVSVRCGMTRDSLFMIFAGGALAGITALFHLNGIAFVAAGLGLLLVNKAYRELVVFGFAASIAFAPYFIELLPAENFSRFLYQLQNDPAVKADETGVYGYLLKLVTAPKRFFSHLYEATFTLLFLLVLVVHWKKILRNVELRQVLVYFLLLELVLAVISPGAKTMYLVYHIPYLLVIISAALYFSLQGDRGRNAFMAMVALFVLTQLGHTYSIASKRNVSLPDAHAAIMEKYEIDNEQKILAPVHFIFNEIGNARIESLTSARIRLEAANSPYTLESLMHYAHANDKDYVIVDQGMLRRIDNGLPEIGTIQYRYELVGIENGLYVFRNTA